jgi:carbonic anhydrase/acetyltransferase-like protein (isoleucine patch superfamily)
MKENPADRNTEFVDHPGALTMEDPLVWFSRATSKLRTLWLRRTYGFASFGKGAWVHHSIRLKRSAARYISIGEDVGIQRDVWLDVAAVPGMDPPSLILEAGCHVQRRMMISVRNRIHVGRNVITGQSVQLIDHGPEVAAATDPKSPRQDKARGTIRIEEGCWIGYGAVVICEQGELVIGRHSIVGANSIVRSSIPAYSVVAGDPARIVKQYDPSKGKWVLGCIRPAASLNRQDRDPLASTLC